MYDKTCWYAGIPIHRVMMGRPPMWSYSHDCHSSQDSVNHALHVEEDTDSHPFHCKQTEVYLRPKQYETGFEVPNKSFAVTLRRLALRIKPTSLKCSRSIFAIASRAKGYRVCLMVDGWMCSNKLCT